MAVPGLHTGDTHEDPGDTGPCPVGMVHIDEGGWNFCIDRYEAALDGWSPFEIPGTGHTAVVGAGLTPQGYISGTVAADACAE